MSNSFCVRGMMLYSKANNLAQTWVYEGKYSYHLTKKIEKEMTIIAQNAQENLHKGFMPKIIDKKHFLFRIMG